MPEITKILVVRNDKIGDFVLALPAIQAIKKAFPNATVTALVPKYTQAIAESFAWIDDVIIDSKDPEQKALLAKQLQEQGFDAAICLFSDRYNATLVRQAKIPVRLAPATKWVQFLYTHRLKQRRSQSLKPEFRYNLDLAHYFIEVLGGKVSSDVSDIFTYSDEVLVQQRTKLESIGVPANKKLCFVHPVTGGSSNTLSNDQWGELICFLDSLDDFQFVITAGPGESQASQGLVDSLDGKVKAILYDKNDGLADFMCSIATGSLFLAGSTGPLHIAGALDVPTIGFYPKKRSSTPLRWQTLNTSGRWLPMSPNEVEDQLMDMKVASRFTEIEAWYKELIRKN